ncbi:DegT/DnrJ/EryC1/StrS family aminotransferase [Moorena bouillonii]|uniref:DegT/DnrJ/EryC1/StrS family aminotransferase n=1 Tax=Moorena bouillonii TaxID=207920 RepID=UPI00096AC57A|nr:DegT/DnrJ/EryC1/StrS family aminotransferase [Moorena bouillonii]
MSGPGWNLIGKEELDEVIEVITSRELSRYRFDDQTGRSIPKVYQFEREFEKFTGAKHCLALNSGTSALLAALAALGIGPGDEVIVPGYTFIASIASVAYSRGIPILAEIDESLTIDPDDVERKITHRTKAIMAVHMLGKPCNMTRLKEIANRHNLYLVEDVAQACGASYKGKKLGTIGDVGAFSLNVFKVITSGEGGMLITNNTNTYERAFAFHDHGSQPFRLGLAGEGNLLGLNLRMNELVGAVALAQVRKLAKILSTLKDKKYKFKKALSLIPNLYFQNIHDEEGDASTTLTLLFESQSVAKAVAKSIGSKTLLQSGKHYYGNMVQLLNKNMPTEYGCPFACENSYPSKVVYTQGMLPQTDDILGRAITLSIGVSDSYLGTDFGINIFYEDESIAEKAQEFRDLTASIMT